MTSWWMRTHVRLRIGGHRGAPREAPENTLASVRRAIELGADYVEVDVHLSRNGELMVVHDETLERTTSGTGPVAALTAEELHKLDAGRWFGAAFAGEPVPRLVEILAIMEASAAAGRRVGAVVEAKGAGTGRSLAHALAASWIRDRLAICSFDAGELRAARVADPMVPTMLIVDRDRPGEDPVALARACGASLVNVPAAWLGAADVDRLHAAGLGVAGGTADDRATLGRAMAIGIDAIDSNVPGDAVRWRTEEGRPP